MACAAKFIRTLPKNFIYISSSSSSPSSLYHSKVFAKFEPLKSLPKNFRPQLGNSISNFRFTFKSPLRGGQLSKGTILVGSVVLGSISSWPNVSLAMNDRFMDDRQEDVDALHLRKHEETFWKFASKLWVPIIFCLTVLTNLDHPLTLVATKVLLFLFSTKPSPLSVYIFVDQLCHSSCQERHFYNQKCLYASKVEVQDYKLLCVARVEIEQQKFTLLGILGGWWALPSLTPATAREFNVFRNIAMDHDRIFI